MTNNNNNNEDSDASGDAGLNHPERMEKAPSWRHLVEEYHYSRWPSLAKFRQSRVTWLTVAVFATAWLGMLNILVINRPLSGATWLNAFVLGVLTVIIVKHSIVLYRELFKPVSDVRHGAFPVIDPLEPFWVAEIDRYTGNRADEYHREFVHVSAPSQADASAAIRHEHDADDEDIVYIRHVEPTVHHISDTLQFRSPTAWIDRRDDPIKVYTTWRLAAANSMHARSPTRERDVILHSVAGISSSDVFMNTRTFTEEIAYLEVHELVHWALEQDEQPKSVWDEVGWHDVIWGALDYVQEGEHPGPWYDDERRTRAQLTSREARENTAERIPHNS